VECVGFVGAGGVSTGGDAVVVDGVLTPDVTVLSDDG